MVYSTDKAVVQRGIINRYTHIGSAVTKGCTFFLFQYLCIIKLTKMFKYLKKSQLALPTNSCNSLRNPNPVEFPCEIDVHQSQCIDN